MTEPDEPRGENSDNVPAVPKRVLSTYARGYRAPAVERFDR